MNLNVHFHLSFFQLMHGGRINTKKGLVYPMITHWWLMTTGPLPDWHIIHLQCGKIPNIYMKIKASHTFHILSSDVQFFFA